MESGVGQSINTTEVFQRFAILWRNISRKFFSMFEKSGIIVIYSAAKRLHYIGYDSIDGPGVVSVLYLKVSSI